MVKWRNCMKSNLSFIPRIFLSASWIRFLCHWRSLNVSPGKLAVPDQESGGTGMSKRWVKKSSGRIFDFPAELSTNFANNLTHLLVNRKPLQGIQCQPRGESQLHYTTPFFISTDSVDTPCMSAILAFSLRVAGIDCNQEEMGRESLSRIAFALALCHFLSPLRRGQVYVPFILAFLSLK